MSFRIAADAVLLLHAAFVAFVTLGALLALRWRRVMWVHVPAMAWGVLAESTARICPLTYVENTLRIHAGDAGYGGSFIEHYVLRMLYPDGLTVTTQIKLALALIAINAVIYAWVFWPRRRSQLHPAR